MNSSCITVTDGEFRATSWCKDVEKASKIIQIKQIKKMFSWNLSLGNLHSSLNFIDLKVEQNSRLVILKNLMVNISNEQSRKKVPKQKKCDCNSYISITDINYRKNITEYEIILM